MYIKPRSGENLLLIWFRWLVQRVLSSTSEPTDDLNLILVILGDPGAVSRDDTMFMVKVYNKLSPQTLYRHD